MKKIINALLFAVVALLAFMTLTVAVAQEAQPTAGLFDQIGNLFQSNLGQFVLSSGLGLFLLKLAAPTVAEVAARVPFFGPTLSKTVLVLAGEFEHYLTSKVPKVAENAVLASEELFRNTPAAGTLKLGTALEHLRREAVPIAHDTLRLEQAIYAALTKMRAEGYEQKREAA